eukprot:1138656-Pelagomonas_calceolata.AAC.5
MKRSSNFHCCQVFQRKIGIQLKTEQEKASETLTQVPSGPTVINCLPLVTQCLDLSAPTQHVSFVPLATQHVGCCSEISKQIFHASCSQYVPKSLQHNLEHLIPLDTCHFGHCSNICKMIHFMPPPATQCHLYGFLTIKAVAGHLCGHDLMHYCFGHDHYIAGMRALTIEPECEAVAGYLCGHDLMRYCLGHEHCKAASLRVHIH